MGILSDLYNQTRLYNKDDRKESGNNTPDKPVEESTEKKEENKEK